MSDPLASIIAAPTDLAPRRAYAEAVRAKDPQRAELIDLQLAIRAGSADDAAVARARMLAHQKGAAWAGPIAELTTSFTYYGGFIESVELTPAQMANGARLAMLAPIRHLRTRDLHGKLDALLALPFLGHIVTLDVGKNKLDDAELSRIATAPSLSNLVVINAANNPITDVGLRSLVALPKLRFIETEGTGAELVRRIDDGDDDSSLQWTSTREDLIRALGVLPWLAAKSSPSYAAL